MFLQDSLDALKGIYPIVWRLMGETCAQQVTSIFVQKGFYFKDLSLFLESFSSLKPFPYLGDVARLEWIQHQSLLSPFKRSLITQQLNFSPEEIPPLCFVAHPSLALFASPYPLEKILHLTESSEKINLAPESSWILVFRPGTTVETYWLTCETYTFFESLIDGHNLVQSLEKVLALCPTFDVQEALRFAFSKNFFVATYLAFPRDESILVS